MIRCSFPFVIDIACITILITSVNKFTEEYISQSTAIVSVRSARNIP